MTLIISCLSPAGPYPKLMLMQPRPMAETSKLLFPSVRFFIIVFLRFLNPASDQHRLATVSGHFESAIRWAKFLPRRERREKTNWRLQSPAGRRLRSVPGCVV